MTRMPDWLEWSRKIGPAYELVDPNYVRGVNVEFFNHTARSLHLVGYDHLADLYPAGVSRDAGALTRLMLTADGLTLSAITQVADTTRSKHWYSRLRNWVKPTYGACSLALYTRFANGMHFITDIGDPKLDRNDPTGIHLMTLPMHTEAQDLARVHIERLRAYRLALPLVRPVPFGDYRDYQRMENLLAGRREHAG
ncbi:hypothetical protein KSF73_07275 [Burkholderiaceae bacterium DAT-1]|nr:hypothetical protein [Burkholderiaceae bacterium DAT-1]